MKKILLTAVCLGLLAANCNKEDDPVADSTPVGGNTVVSVSFHWKWGPNNLDTTLICTTTMGEPIKFRRVQFFVAQPYFQDDNGALVQEFPSKYLLVDLADGALVQNIGELNGHLQTMHLTLGLDSAANHADPTQYAIDNPLSVSTGMHWSWTDGYVFMRLEGWYDSNNDGLVNLADNMFSYHCPTDIMRRLHQVELHQDALTGGALVIDLDLDMAVVIGSTDIQNNNFGTVANATTITLMDNLVTAITAP